MLYLQQALGDHLDWEVLCVVEREREREIAERERDPGVESDGSKSKKVKGSQRKYTRCNLECRLH
jgi:hypothetical protein